MLAFLIIILLSVLILWVIEIVRKSHSYWEKRGVKGPKPHPVYGHYEKFIKKQTALFTLIDELYNRYRDEKVVGIYQGLSPALIIRDPDLIKMVLVKEFPSFQDRGVQVGLGDPLIQNLFFLDGDKWRLLRQKLSPMFTISKIKQTMPLLDQCVSEYMLHTETLIQSSGIQDIRSLNTKYTVKVVASMAFGLDINIFTDKDCTFDVMAKKLFMPNFRTRLATILNGILPGVTEIMGLKLVHPDVRNFFFTIVKEILEAKRDHLKTRRDFMDFIIDLKEQGTIKDSKRVGDSEIELNEGVIAAIAMMFYIGGFETTSGVMSFLLYELALNPKVQEKCYEEIKAVMRKHGSKLTYETLSEFKYLSMAFDEALRKHPIIPLFFRKCVSNYQRSDGTVVIEKGTNILIPASALHMDAQYFSEPDVFNPDRFAPENKADIKDFTYMPFGGGPRICIGMRLGKLQAMMGIVHFLHKFKLEPCEKTVPTIKPAPLLFTQSHSGGLWLNISPRATIDK